MRTINLAHDVVSVHQLPQDEALRQTSMEGPEWDRQQRIMEATGMVLQFREVTHGHKRNVFLDWHFCHIDGQTTICGLDIAQRTCDFIPATAPMPTQQNVCRHCLQNMEDPAEFEMLGDVDGYCDHVIGVWQA